MGLLDLFTGNKSQGATNALNDARKAFENIPVPTVADLTLPELQQYVQAGILTPAQAQAVLVQGNAYNDIKVDPSTTEAETDALNKIKGVSEGGGMTDEMKAQLTSALDQVATNTHGTNAAISDQFAQKGIPSSLMAEAAMRDEAGNDARNANLTATQAAGQAEANAIAAMMNEGNLASTMHGQQYSEAANKANAENALRQWNAGTGTAVNEANANRNQAANVYNTTTKQNVADSNTGLANKRTEYNAAIPETIFGNQITKAGGIAGADQAQAKLQQEQGQQNAGIISGAINTATGSFGKMPTAQTSTPPPGYNPSMTEDMLPAAHGAIVPGRPSVPGDSPVNDTVHARLSPGEVVVPRSIAPHPEAVKRFVGHLMRQKPPVTPVHPQDVHSVLEALTQRRNS